MMYLTKVDIGITGFLDLNLLVPAKSTENLMKKLMHADFADISNFYNFLSSISLF